MRKLGTHIIADFYQCNFSKFDNRPILDIQKDISTMIIKNDLQELGNYYHFFGPQAISGVISLSESHLTFHSWPEYKYLSLDIFVCNFNKNNKKNALSLYQDLINYFEPKKIRRKILSR